jgi:hypothetical protein
MSTIYLILASAALILMGAAVTVMVHHFRRQHSTDRLRRIEAVIGTFFTLVGVLVTADLAGLTFAFNDYVEETLKRDTAQEACAANTINTLKHWAQARLEADQAARRRDAALLPLFDQLQRGEKVNPETASQVERSFTDVEAARQKLEYVWKAFPLPDCTVRP